jgi:hypothetical protein
VDDLIDENEPQPNSGRADGMYFVRLVTEWHVAEWRDGRWRLLSDPSLHVRVLEVGPRAEPHPSNSKL